MAVDPVNFDDTVKIIPLIGQLHASSSVHLKASINVIEKQLMMVIKYREKHFARREAPTPSAKVPHTLSSIDSYRQRLVEATTRIDGLKAFASSLATREAHPKTQIAALQSELR